ncbi:hypothetical protein ALQ54_01905 [Pseudomonas syringae]|uniref:Uncharacterized protein n=1 Tax=Pseudomonas syringae TaxID=317 RepID=A0AB38BNY2_PSESX|nr:hypothetical protein [Pseudomonas sp. PvP007]MBP1196923.1 hypothetical protein [Pseudomonas sp. PvP100]RMN74369.1 hypothetical protein ALQ54_01905 [Pseudomonas syringae]SFN68273.1 hypothetical protein SAMN05444065_102264 [Pseudomonas syringae]SFO13026.1 hypothetical protein SAMN05444063_101265 [Pseudomonas syringae]
MARLIGGELPQVSIAAPPERVKVKQAEARSTHEG